VLVATDGSLKKRWIMEAAVVARAKDSRVPSHSVAVLSQPSSIRLEPTDIVALAMGNCPGEDHADDRNILTDCLSAMKLFKCMQRKDFPLKSFL
jgi:hypothetical protein